MATLFEVVVDRVATVLALAATRELETNALARQMERTASLMRLADGYQAEGYTDLAVEVRRRACNDEGPRTSVEAASVPVLTHILPPTNDSATAPSPKKKPK